MSGIIAAIGQLVDFALGFYTWIVLARVLVGWVAPDPRNPMVLFLYRATEPVMGPLRRRLPTLAGIDFSPVVVFLGILFLQKLVRLLTMPSHGGPGIFPTIAAEILMVVHLLGTLLLVLLLARIWFSIRTWHSFRRGIFTPINLANPLTRFLFQTTEPLLRSMREWFPTLYGLDLSPLVAAVMVVAFLLLIQEGITLLLAG